MRSFTFDVYVMMNANGFRRTTSGVDNLRLARSLVRSGRATLVLDSTAFAGYGGSTDVGYSRDTYTVTEVPGAFSA